MPALPIEQDEVYLPDYRAIRHRLHESGRAVQERAKQERRQALLAKIEEARERERRLDEQLAAAQARIEQKLASIANSDQPPLRVIAKQVARSHGVSFEEISQPCRKKKGWQYTHIRQHCMYECRRLRPDLSLSDIGRLFNCMDHSSVVHGIKSHAARHDLPVPVGNHPIAGRKRGYHGRLTS